MVNKSGKEKHHHKDPDPAQNHDADPDPEQGGGGNVIQKCASPLAKSYHYDWLVNMYLIFCVRDLVISFFYDQLFCSLRQGLLVLDKFLKKNYEKILTN
jgi:hypothetical protein